MRCLSLVALFIALSSGFVRADGVDAAAATGSERLTYLASTLDLQTTGGVSALRNFVALSSKVGFNVLDKTKRLHGSRVSPPSLKPVLKYDDNINGGNKADRVEFGNGLVLNFPADSLAQGDVLAGLQFSSGARVFYGRGRYLDVSSSVGNAWGLRTRLSQLTWGASACSRNHVAGWSFVDLCASHSGKKKALGESRENRAEIVLTQLQSISTHAFEVRGKAFRQDSSGEWNNGVGIQLLGVLNDTTSIDFSIESEQESASHRYQVYDASAGVNFKIAGRAVSLELGRSLMSNAKLLGETFDIESTSVSASVPIGKSSVVHLSLDKNTAPLQLYQTTTVGLSVDFTGRLFSRLFQ